MCEHLINIVSYTKTKCLQTTGTQYYQAALEPDCFFCQLYAELFTRAAVNSNINIFNYEDCTQGTLKIIQREIA